MRPRVSLALPLALAATLASSGCASAPARTPGPPPPQGSVTIAAFERNLSPYGDWLFLAPYGRVWQPAGVTAEWRPYFHGEWIWTDEGWFWASDEPWGWATYHYGSWLLDGTFGWVWVPGEEWAPAWVAWRVADGHVGWAPLLPGGDVWWTDAYLADPAYWVFVPSARFVGARANAVAIPPPQVRPLLARARPAPPPGHGVAAAPPHGGPPRANVERDAGRPVPPARIVPVPTPGEARARPDRETVPAYRPAPPPAARPAPAPAPAPARGEVTKEGKQGGRD